MNKMNDKNELIKWMIKMNLIKKYNAVVRWIKYKLIDCLVMYIYIFSEALS